MIAKNLAQKHNEGLDYIYKNIDNESYLRSLSQSDVNDKLLELTFEYISTKIQNTTYRTTKSTFIDNTDTVFQINQIINDYDNYGSIKEIMNERTLNYANIAEKYLNDSTINIDSLSNTIASDPELSYTERVALCSFVKTLQYSKSYWNNNVWRSSKACARSNISKESVVFSDCYFLWFGTLSGGPIVGVGAGVVASAISAVM